MTDSPSDSPNVRSDRLLELMERWQSLQQQGQTVSAAVFCADCPELTDDLARLARFVRQVETLAADQTPPDSESATGSALLATPRPADAMIGPAPAGSPEDRYVIEAKLGEGGMGAVYRARDRLLGRAVALKVIRPDVLTPAMRARFEAEARAVARLDHPHIVKVFDVGSLRMSGESAPVPFLTLELVEGGSLARQLGGAPLPVAEAVRLVDLLAGALQHAHDRGIVHRDLKLDNVLLAPPSSLAALNIALGCPKVTDFGLARETAGGQRLTRTGAVVGTPNWMAPEQAEGRGDIGPPADVWALGVMLYRLVAGGMPFASPSLADLLHQICHAEPVPLEQARPGISAELAAVVRDCLQKRPADRPTAAALAQRLERLLPTAPGAAEGIPEPPTEPEASHLRPKPRRVRARAGVMAGLVGVALLGGLAWVLRPGPTGDERPSLEGDARPEPRLADDTSRLRIRPLQVMHFETIGKEAVPRGRIGEQSFATRYGDAVTLTVELTEAAYFYVIGFNFDGQEQLLWPVDEQGKPSRDVIPPRQQRLPRYPLGEKRLYLDDEAPSGLQVYAVAASRRPLSAYREWRQGRRGVSWRALPAGRLVWQADPQAAYEVLPGLGANRGSLREAAGAPPLSGLCRCLRDGGVEVVEAIAFPVLPREGER